MNLSIVVPCYNEEKRIGRFLDSLKRQTVRPEMIFVDGGSTDATVQMIESLGWAKLLREDVDRRSPANARNIGIDAAIGDILCSLNVDTICEDDYTKKIIDAFEKYPNADGITFIHKQNIPKMNMLGKALFLRDQIFGYNGKYTVMKSWWWKKLHYDESLGFGEDRYLRQAASEIPCKIIQVNEEICVSEISFQDLGGFVKRNLWYGRTIPRFLMKTSDLPIAMYLMLSILFIPFLLAGFITMIGVSFIMAGYIIALVGLYGIYRMLRVMLKGYLWKEAYLIPSLEILGFIFIGIGFYQFLFGNKVIGR